MRKLRISESLLRNPPLVLSLSFLLVILLGTFFLALPMASKNGASVGLTDAFFTASSATCVTGLVVKSTLDHWTLFGQLVILCLIQVGGLGTMTFVTLFAMVTGQKIGLTNRLLIKEQLNLETYSGLVRFILFVFVSSFLIEALGALVLSSQFVASYGFKRGVWYGVFHAVSAFCNGGFDLLGDSIRVFQDNYVVNLTIMALVILGGLGFIVYMDLLQHLKKRGLSVHTRLVLLTNFFLLALGTLGFYLLERDNPATLAGLPEDIKWLASAFHSTVLRTAGFYSVPVEDLGQGASFFSILLMFIGGSPASTAGGLKTTTLVILFLSILGLLRGQEEVTLYKRRITSRVINRAFAIFFVCVLLLVVDSFLLILFEGGKFSYSDILFETTSAMATVGMSRGITASLSTGSKWVLALTMFLGRVGPASFAIGLFRERHKSKLHYPAGHFIVG
ncbi:MAG: TrkH family potassium uptake protein [Tissierellia bacterium]|nr:TrkH family potassium uptake protein [Tissierellia bacterium]